MPKKAKFSNIKTSFWMCPKTNAEQWIWINGAGSKCSIPKPSRNLSFKSPNSTFIHKNPCINTSTLMKESSLTKYLNTNLKFEALFWWMIMSSLPIIRPETLSFMNDKRTIFMCWTVSLFGLIVPRKCYIKRWYLFNKRNIWWPWNQIKRNLSTSL